MDGVAFDTIINNKYSRIAVHVRNQEECDAVLAVCRECGMAWPDNKHGRAADCAPIRSYGANAAIKVSDPLGYASIRYFTDTGYKVVSADQFLEMGPNTLTADAASIYTTTEVVDTSKPKVQIVNQLHDKVSGTNDLKRSIEKHLLPFCGGDVILQTVAYNQTFVYPQVPDTAHYTVVYTAGIPITPRTITIKGKNIIRLAFLPANSKSTLFIDPVSGEALAEITDKSIHLLFYGLVVDGTEEFVNLTDKIMQFAASFIGGPAYNAETPTQTVADMSTEIGRLLEQKANANIRKYTDIKNSKYQQIAQIKSDLTTAFKEYIFATNAVEESTKIRSIEPEILLRKIDKIYLYKHVERLSIHTDIFNIYTDNIVVYTEAGKRDIGKFKISVNLIDGKVHFYNLTRRVNGYGRGMNAPHVYADGRPCLGNIAEALTKAIAEFEIEAIVNICIAYITSVNTEDVAGAKISCWPKIT